MSTVAGMAAAAGQSHVVGSSVGMPAFAGHPMCVACIITVFATTVLYCVVLQGGNSSSGLSAAEDGSGAVWNGDLIVEVSACMTVRKGGPPIIWRKSRNHPVPS